MIDLQTFGGAAVASNEHGQLGSAASQRRVVALLALAASAGSTGVTRDRAMALLWPETNTDKARHSLSQTLYNVRSAVRDPDIFLPGNDIRLNPANLRVDIWEFDRLIETRNDTGAVAIYRGPFLDGFFLPRSGEFEEWVSSQRRHFTSAAIGALGRLSADAEKKNDWTALLEWRRRLVAADPVSSRATLKLMEALVDAGDSAAALVHAEAHRRMVRVVLETEPDASVTDFEARLRTVPSAEKRSPPLPANVAPPALVATHEVREHFRNNLPPTVRERTSRRRGVQLTVGALLAAAGALAWFGTSASADTAEARKRIVVAPFRVNGADRSLAYLQEGMVDLLAARFPDESLTHAVDPGQTIAAWRRVGATGAGADHETALQLAKRVGATGVIVGSVVGNAARLYVTATLLTSSGTRDVEVTADGPADSLTSIVDRLAGELLAAKYGEADRLVSRTTSSLPALRAYLTGQAAYRRGEYGTAVRQFDAALRADSQFALAALQLALSSDRLNDGEQNDRALTIAWLNREELSPRDRAHLVAFAGPNYPLPSSASQSLAAWESALNLTPARADIWYEFGERLFRQGSPLGIQDGASRAVRAFTRALELDPSDREGARPMLVLAAARLRDTATVRRYASATAVRDSMGALSPFVRWTVARLQQDRQALTRLRANLPQLDDDNLRLIAMSSLYDGELLADGERAANVLGRRAAASRGLDVLLAQHAFALNAGDAFRALDVTERIEERIPGMRAHLRLRVLDALYGNGNRNAAVNAAALLEQVKDPGSRGTELDRAVFYSDLCVLEQWRLTQGDNARTRASIKTLHAAGFTREPIAIGANPHTCAVLLEAWLAVNERKPSAREQLVTLDSLLLDGPASGDAATYAHILLARLHDRFDDHERALIAIRRRSYLTGWPRYVATSSAGEAMFARMSRPAIEPRRCCSGSDH